MHGELPGAASAFLSVASRVEVATFFTGRGARPRCRTQSVPSRRWNEAEGVPLRGALALRSSAARGRLSSLYEGCAQRCTCELNVGLLSIGPLGDLSTMSIKTRYYKPTYLSSIRYWKVVGQYARAISPTVWG